MSDSTIAEKQSHKVSINIPMGMKFVGNEKKVNAITKAVIRCEGFCPCVHTEEIKDKEDLRCPCLQSRVENICVCGLYEKE